MPDTNATVADPRELIDHKMIAKADQDRDATLTADREAQVALAEAEKALRAAARAADSAAATGASVQAERAVIDCEIRLRAAQRRAKAAGTAAAEAPAVHKRAIGLAHRHAVFDAVARRLAACRAAEDADRARKKADDDFAAATADLLNSVNAGAPLPGGLDAPRHLQPEKTELQYWTAHQVDIANRIFYPGEKR